MKLTVAMAVLVLTVSSFAVDQKSLLLGFALGAGTLVTKNYVALPVASAAAKSVKAPLHMVQRKRFTARCSKQCTRDGLHL